MKLLKMINELLIEEVDTIKVISIILIIKGIVHMAASYSLLFWECIEFINHAMTILAVVIGLTLQFMAKRIQVQITDKGET